MNIQQLRKLAPSTSKGELMALVTAAPVTVTVCPAAKTSKRAAYDANRPRKAAKPEKLDTIFTVLAEIEAYTETRKRKDPETERVFWGHVDGKHRALIRLVLRHHPTDLATLRTVAAVVIEHLEAIRPSAPMRAFQRRLEAVAG